jgi:transcription elongation factor Elf1
MKHREQVYARVRKAQYKFDPSWNCLICGHNWARVCTEHSANENIKMCKQVMEIDGVERD